MQKPFAPICGFAMFCICQVFLFKTIKSICSTASLCMVYFGSRRAFGARTSSFKWWGLCMVRLCFDALARKFVFAIWFRAAIHCLCFSCWQSVAKMVPFCIYWNNVIFTWGAQQFLDFCTLWFWIVFLFSFLVPCALYLQQFGTRTCHFAWFFFYIWQWPPSILHCICYIWPCLPSILHGICSMLALQPFICMVFATSYNFKRSCRFLEGFFSGFHLESPCGFHARVSLGFHLYSGRLGFLSV